MPTGDNPNSRHGLDDYNEQRHHQAALTQVRDAIRALPALEWQQSNTPPDTRTWRALEAGIDTVLVRIAYPQDTVEQLAAKLGLTKAAYWRRYTRAIQRVEVE